VTVGGVLADAARLYVRFFWRSLVVAAAIFIVFTIPAAVVDTLRDTRLTILIATLLVTLFTSYGDFLLEGTLAVDIKQHREVGAVPKLRALLRRTRPHLLTLLAATLVYSVSIVVGLVLLVVPGLIVLVRWSVIVPVIVIEGRGMRDAFKRSNQLVQGHSWTVLWILLIIFIIAGLLETWFDNLLHPLLPEFFSSWLGHFLVSVITAPYAAHALAVIYFRLVENERSRSS
jgi:Membrane domain of glycerophosphoryl diester phosphodiesterase